MIEKKHNYFYKITNLVNGKYYYGIRSFDGNIEDDYYFGSGKILRKSIKKYGKDNFTKEIIADYPTRKEASDHEKRVVNLELIQLKECYNCRTGGDNEFTPSKEVREKMSKSKIGRKHTEETKEKLKEYVRNRVYSDKAMATFRKIGLSRKGCILSEDHKTKIKESTIGDKNPFYGKKHTEETKIKLREAKSGQNHPFYGKKLPSTTCEKISAAKFNKPRITSRKCIIEGVVYNMVAEARRKYNLGDGTVQNRIASTDEKFKDWNWYIGD
jgi:hypothetical protein